MNSSRIASPVGDSASAACRCRSRSSNDSSRKRPRWPPESAGLSTAGKPTVSAAGAASRRARTAANRGCGTPPSASLRRIATLCVIRCAVFVPIPGSPSASATAATTGTARSAETVSTPSTASRRATSITRLDVDEVDDLGLVGVLEPGRVGVAVDRDDAQPELLRAQDRAPLVAPRADEEDGLHSRAMLLGEQERDAGPSARSRSRSAA